MVSSFIKWIKESVIEEGIWGSWQYKLPSDKKQQMYDFYMLAYLLPKGAENIATQVLMATDTGHQAKFEYSLQEASDILLPALREELLEAVMFALSAEIRHLYDRPENDVKKLMSIIERELGPNYAQMLRKYTLNLINYKNPVTKSLLDRETLSGNLNTSSSSYKNSYRAMRLAGGSEEDWAKLCDWLFTNAVWSGAFGGKAWAGIAQGWLHLYHAKTIKDLLGYIDHVYDLQHNTDTVFNKLETYAKEGGYGWIKEALDHKRYLISPHEMLEHVSPPMKELALIGIKIRTGKTWHDFEKEWPEILKQKADIYNDVVKTNWQKHGYGDAPIITPQQFAKQQIKQSAHPWSVWHMTQDYLKTLPPPEIKDANGKPISVGDTVKKRMTSQPNRIGKVTSIDSQNGTVSVQWEGHINKNYQPQDLIVQSAIVLPATPAAPITPAAAPAIVPQQPPDLEKFKAGDKIALKAAPGANDWYTVTGTGGGKVGVKDNIGFTYSFLPGVILHHQKAPGSSISWHGVTPPETPPVFEKPPPAYKPAVKPMWTPPTPEEKTEQDKQKVNQLWNNLPKMSKTLKLARTVRGLHTNLSFDQAFNQVEKILGTQFTSAEREEAKQHFQDEDSAIAYYKTRGHMKFPKGMNNSQAWDMIQTKFPDPPHVILDPDTMTNIEDLLKNHNDIKAIAAFRNSTQFDLPSSKGWAVYKKLEMYMNQEIKD